MRFDCPHCEIELEAGPELAGQTIECPECNGEILMPAEIEEDVLALSGCISCAEPLAEGAVICIACGTNQQTGEQLQMAAEAAAEVAPEPEPAPVAEPPAASGPKKRFVMKKKGGSATSKTVPSKAATPPKSRPEEPFCVAYRIAGGMLLLNSILLFAEMFQNAGSGVNPSSGVGGVIIGILLLSGKRSGLTWARFAVCAGAVIFSIVAAAQGDYVTMVLQLVYSVTLLGLILGRPGIIRTIAFTIIGVLFFGLTVVGLMIGDSSSNPVAQQIAAIQLGLEPITGGRVEGVDFDYTLTAPNQNWSRRNHAQARQQNPDADIWLVDSVAGAHVLVVGEDISQINGPGGMPPFLIGVTQSLQANMPSFRVIGSSVQQPSGGYERAVLTGTAVIEGQELIYKVGLRLRNRMGYQILCFSLAKDFPRVEPAFDSIIASFKQKTPRNTSTRRRTTTR